MGLAVDVDKGDGTRTLVVPVAARRRHDRLRRVPRRLRGADPQGQDEQAGGRGLPGRHDHARPTPARSARCSRVPRLMPGPGRDRRRRHHRLPGRVAGCRRADPRRARRHQGRHDHLHVRPPHHPGRRERHVPEARPRAAHSASTASTTRCSAASACRTRRCSGARTCSPIEQRERRAAEADAGRHARPRAPRARSPHRRPRSVARGTSRRCTTSSTRPPTA